MSPQDIESSINEIIDGAKEDPTIEYLRKLLITVETNRRIMEIERMWGKPITEQAQKILKALDEGDKCKAADIAIMAKMAGFDPNNLKAVCRALKKKL